MRFKLAALALAPLMTLFALCGLTRGAAIAADETTSMQDLAGELASEPTAAATIYSAREFITMDPARPRAQAVAVRDGRFIAVGNRVEVEAVAGANARIDETFAGKVVLPGFVEQHVHPVLAALTMNTKVISIEDWDAIDGFSPAVRDAKGYQVRLKRAIEEHRTTHKDATFVTWGYNGTFHGPMSRAALDKLAPDFPIVIWSRSTHEFFLNTLALQKAGIDQALMDTFTASQKEQASLQEGHFLEQGAMAILNRLTPIIATPAAFRRGLEFTVGYYHRNGITTACEPGGFYSKALQDAINAVYSDDATPFNHYFIADGKTFVAKHPNDAKAMILDTRQVLDWGKGRTRYLPKQVKFLTDGAIFSQLMQMKDGYTDGHKGAWIMDPEVFSYAFQNYWDAGYQIHVHNNGDAGMDVLLGELEKAMQRSPRKDHRTVLVHFGFATPEQVALWAQLGGIVSSNPYYVTALAGRYAKVGIGPERAKNMVPMGDVVKNHMSFSFHSDMPMAPAKPLQLVWAGITRMTYEGEVAGPEHRVTLDQALRAVTIDAAYSIQLEQDVGSIEVGKYANLAVLDRSPYDVDPAAVKDIGLWGTVLEGRLQPVKDAATTAAAAAADRTVVASGQEVAQAAIEQLTRLITD